MILLPDTKLIHSCETTPKLYPNIESSFVVKMPVNRFPNIEEQDVWNSFREGDDKSLEMIYRAYFDELYSYGNKWLKDATLTEDSIQDLFVKLMRTRNNLSATVSIKFYLFRSFRSIVLDKIKANNKISLIDDPKENMFQIDLSPEQKMIDTEEAKLLKRKLAIAMESLTPRQREAIFLKFTEGFSYPQISEMLELTTKGTYKLMARAIDALKQNIHPLSLLLLYRLLLP